MARKKAMTIAIEREDDKMTITIAPVETKTRVYYVDGYKCSRATANLCVQSYINWIVNGELPNATIYLDERLAEDYGGDNFPQIIDDYFDFEHCGEDFANDTNGEFTRYGFFGLKGLIDYEALVAYCD